MTAFDGVNDGVPTTINVTVVETNSPPSVSVAKRIEDLTGAKKLISASALEVPFTAVITPGVAGETGKVTFRTVVGTPTGATTDPKPFVSAKTTDGAVSGSYILTVTRLLAGKDDKSEKNKITIFAQDSFGAETMVATLMAEANAPPRVKRKLPANVYLYRSANVTADASGVADVLAQTGKYRNTVFTLTDFFAVEMDGLECAVDPVDDTTCTFSTNPSQPTAFDAVVAGGGCRHRNRPSCGPGWSDQEDYEGFGIEWSRDC